MYEVTIRGGFRASHQIRYPNGVLEELHPHDWKVEIGFRDREVGEYGVLVDFVKAQEALERITSHLEGCNLNHHALLGGRNPTAEFVARALFEEMIVEFEDSSSLYCVAVEEAPGCVATFFGSRDQTTTAPD